MKGSFKLTIRNFWIYPFLDYTKATDAFFYFGILLALVIFFFGAYALTRLRDFLFTRGKNMNDFVPIE
jgi:hypothetical protein